MSEKPIFPPGSDWMSYPGGLPPASRFVKSCATCAHVEHGYEGETRCTKYREKWDPDEPDQPLSVWKHGLCDSHEEGAQ